MILSCCCGGGGGGGDGRGGCGGKGILPGGADGTTGDPQCACDARVMDGEAADEAAREWLGQCTSLLHSAVIMM